MNQVNTTPQAASPVLAGAMTVNPAALIQRVRDIEQVRDSLMIEGTHFYSLQNKKIKLPDGSEREVPQFSLGKAGAEMMMLAFGLRSEIKSDVVQDDPIASMTITRDVWVDDPNGRGRMKVPQDVQLRWAYEVRSTCTIYSPGGEPLASASGSANSWESAFRGFSTPDAKNPVLKRAEKRALVAAVLMATGCSSLFTQDVEDLPAAGEHPAEKPAAPQGPNNGLSEKQNNLAAVKVRDLIKREEMDPFMEWFRALPSGAKAALDDLSAGGERAMKVVNFWRKKTGHGAPESLAVEAPAAPAPAAQDGGVL